MPFTPFPGTGQPQLQVTTGAAGFTKVNGTPNIISWTAPNDGNVHRVTMFGSVWVSSAETGGQCTLTFTDPGGNVENLVVLGGSQGINGHGFNAGIPVMIQSGSTATFKQTSALTIGASVVYAEMWGS